MKDTIHIGGALGMVIIGVGALITFISSVSIFERGWYGEDTLLLDLTPENLFFFFLGISHLLIGGGLMGKAKWSRRAASFLCWASFIGWTYMVIEVFRFRNMGRFDYWLEIGLTSLGYILLFIGLLFLGNEKVAQEFLETDQEEWGKDILDL